MHLSFTKKNSKYFSSFHKFAENFRKLKTSHTDQGILYSFEHKNIISADFGRSCDIEYLDQIFSKSFELLQNHGFTNTLKTKAYIEYHGYTDGNSMPFEEHVDDYGAIDFNCNTIIFYLTNSIQGGNLEILENISKIKHESKFESLNVYNTHPECGEIVIICLEGNVWHNITKMRSVGIRECIVVQMECSRS